MTPSLDPRKLIYFATIIEQGSLKSAARVLNLSQPALSTSMARLEAELGQHLLERGPKGATPTEVGSVLYAHARRIRDEIALALCAVTQSGAEDGALRIGSLPSLASSVLPAALGRWRQSHQDRGIEVVENAQIDLLLGLLRRDFDFVFGFTECYELEEGLRQRVLFRDRLCVIARPDHPLSHLPDLTWEAIAACPWIYPTARRPHTILEAALKAAGVAMPKQVTVCGSVSILKSLVAGSDHLAMLPAHALRTEQAEGKLISLPIEDPSLDRNIAVFFREGYKVDDSSRHLVEAVEAEGQEVCRRDRLA
jgi:DNA-binding transcriptional LysR family regulator